MSSRRIIAPFFIAIATAIAQTNPQPSSPQPRFEVASVKPTPPGAGGSVFRFAPGGRLIITNITLKTMITRAFRVLGFQIYGGPSWLDSARFDASATSANAKDSEMPEMLQALLADRFQLIVRHEMRELPVYALTLAQKDGKLGPNLTASRDGGCTPRDPNRPGPPNPENPWTPGCGGWIRGDGRFAARSVPVSGILPVFSSTLDRKVIDKTGLSGIFDIDLQWNEDDDGPTASDSDHPSIFTAFQEQLGLKLESQKGPVEILVIVRAEKPSEN
jgi:uncharacterized protein (TIGR03435 family)